MFNGEWTKRLSNRMYEPVDVQLHEVRHSRSTKSGISDDTSAEISLIQHQKSFPPQHLFDEISEIRGRPTDKPSRTRRYKYKSWKVGIATATASTTCVLILNCSLLIWASFSFSREGGIGDAYVGDCDTVTAWSRWSHIVINILGSVLLGASNYAMQCLSSPTREECDRAHARGKWLDIGVPSFRNLRSIGRSRTLCWALMALSSLPINLIYNSVVFKTLDANQYVAIAVSANFLDPSEQVPRGWEDSDAARVRDDYLGNSSSFIRLEPDECVSTYATFFLSGHSDVIAVVSPMDGYDRFIYNTFDGGEIEVGTLNGVPYSWICIEATCGGPAYTRQVTSGNWSLNGQPVEYCLSRRVDARCKLQFSIYMTVAVIVCNIIKIAVMLWTLFQQRKPTLVTFGDALSSWLDDPDVSTKGQCLLSKHEVLHRATTQETRPPPQEADLTNHRWHIAASRKSWITTLTLLTLGMIASAICLALAKVQMVNQHHQNMFQSSRFGNADGRMLMQTGPALGAAGLAAAVLFSNWPQVLVSLVYLTYNSLFTNMHLAHEFSNYAIHRKALRVTTPYGQQRKTYWLQLPYTYGIPLVGISAVLHWLVSQAVFLVRIDRNGFGSGMAELQRPKEADMSVIGFSPSPMLALVLAGVCLMSVAVSMGYRRLQGTGMPVAASCSLALAAATHRPDGDVDASVLPVKWGEVVGLGESGVGHCCFTSQEVVAVVPRKKYA